MDRQGASAGRADAAPRRAARLAGGPVRRTAIDLVASTIRKVSASS